MNEEWMTLKELTAAKEWKDGAHVFCNSELFYVSNEGTRLMNRHGDYMIFDRDDLSERRWRFVAPKPAPSFAEVWKAAKAWRELVGPSKVGFAPEANKLTDAIDTYNPATDPLVIAAKEMCNRIQSQGLSYTVCGKKWDALRQAIAAFEKGVADAK